MEVIPLVIPSKEDPPPQPHTAQPQSPHRPASAVTAAAAAAAAMTTAEEEEFEPKAEEKVGWVLYFVCCAYYVLFDATKYVFVSY